MIDIARDGQNVTVTTDGPHTFATPLEAMQFGSRLLAEANEAEQIDPPQLHVEPEPEVPPADEPPPAE